LRRWWASSIFRRGEITGTLPVDSSVFVSSETSVRHTERRRTDIFRHNPTIATRGLGEIALRVNNLDAMQKFYEEVIGLRLMTRVPNCAFFKIADGYGGHTQVLALFDRSASPSHSAPDAKTSTIDHIAFEISPAEFADEKKRLETVGLQVETAERGWVHWRSLYVTDPEGNQVELVCYDGSV
jgi:catechol-2,3-dioxygenase